MIPQAWQAFWQPPQPWPDKGKSPDHQGLELWDAREVPLCRTGHGNVHFLLVRMMEQVPLIPPSTATMPSEQLAAYLAGRAKLGRAPRPELALAGQAIIRFVEAGGDLGALVAAGQLGAI